MFSFAYFEYFYWFSLKIKYQNWDLLKRLLMLSILLWILYSKEWLNWSVILPVQKLIKGDIVFITFFYLHAIKGVNDMILFRTIKWIEINKIFLLNNFLIYSEFIQIKLSFSLHLIYFQFLMDGFEYVKIYFFTANLYEKD